MDIGLEVDKEEGELSDHDDDYTILERPANYSATLGPKERFARPIESESDEKPSSSSDSDSDVEIKRKKLSKPKLLKPRHLVPNKRKKYDIWSTRMQEDVLSETLNSCDVSIKDRSRDVESYDYTLSYSYNKNRGDDALKGNNDENKDAVRTNNKRNRNDRKNSNLRPVKTRNDEESEHKSIPRHILDLAVTCSDTLDDIVADIANKLCEAKEDLIRVIVTEVGAQKAIELFKEVQKIEMEGGMMIMNQTRRRTPGGVYFFLLKHDSKLTKEQHSKIFGEGHEQFKQMQKERKKKRKDEIRQQIMDKRRSKEENLPDLLTKAELCMKQLTSDSNRTRKVSEHLEDVINPPPTPEMEDVNEPEIEDSAANSNVLNQNGPSNTLTLQNDGLNHPNNFEQNCDLNRSENDPNQRKILGYEDDFLDLNTSNEMDLF